jgi:hypothetical protein
MSAFPTAGSNGMRPAIAYGQLGILLELLWRGEETIFAKCDFCQTLNHRFALRCDACSGKLPAAYGAARSLAQDAPTARWTPRGRPAGRSAREMANVLVWVLAMPVLLFVGFVLWQQAWMKGAHTVSSPAESVATTVDAAPSASLPGAVAPLIVADPQALEAEGAPDRTREAAASSRPARQAEAREPVAAARRPSARHDRLPAVAAWRPESDPTAACEGRMFFLRAICLNQRCAEPENARHPRCVAVVRQRLIDEARRNPTLVG